VQPREHMRLAAGTEFAIHPRNMEGPTDQNQKIWVRISPAVWTHFSSVPSEVVSAVCGELEKLAELLPLTNRLSSENTQTTVVRSFQHQGYRAFYELDLRRDAITLLQLVTE
jgi:hypothetical protein